jgi:glutaredoxin-like YruB-family protein
MVNKSITVFTGPGCQYCVQVKKYLASKEIPFTEVDVSLDEEKANAMVERSGMMGLPQLWIGDDVVVGYNIEKIELLLS